MAFIRVFFFFLIAGTYKTIRSSCLGISKRQKKFKISVGVYGLKIDIVIHWALIFSLLHITTGGVGKWDENVVILLKLWIRSVILVRFDYCRCNRLIFGDLIARAYNDCCGLQPCLFLGPRCCLQVGFTLIELWWWFHMFSVAEGTWPWVHPLLENSTNLTEISVGFVEPSVGFV